MIRLGGEERDDDSDGGPRITRIDANGLVKRGLRESNRQRAEKEIFGTRDLKSDWIIGIDGFPLGELNLRPQ